MTFRTVILVLTGSAFFTLNLAAEESAIRISSKQRYSEAHKYLDDGKISEAAALLDGCIKLDPEWAKPYVLRGWIRMKQSMYIIAIADLSEAIRLDAKHASAYAQRGWAYAATGDHQRAIADFNESLQLDPKQPLIYTYRAASFRFTGQFEKSICDCTQALKLDSRCFEAYTNLGAAYLEKMQFDDAIRNLTLAIGLRPKDVECFLERGSAYVSKKEYEMAMLDFVQARDLASDRPDLRLAAFLFLGGTYLAKGDCDRAIESFNAAARLDERCLLAVRLYRGIAFEQNGQYDRAIEEFDLAEKLVNEASPPSLAESKGANSKLLLSCFNAAGVSMAPNRSQVAFQRGLCHLQAGTPKRAIPDFDAVLQHDRDNCEALFYRACALSCEKSWDRAVDDLTRVIKLHPKDWRALGARSYAYSQLGKPVESRADREEAVRLEANEHQKGTEGGGLP